MLVSRYLKNSEISAMADAALNAYEFTASWRRATEAAKEYCTDDLGVYPRRSAILYAVKIARLRWHAATLSTRAAIS
jgi:hypothetical protein